MEKILSQDEVDALLKGISDGAIESDPEVEEDDGNVRRYDLTSQDRIIRGRMPTLEIINDRFARMHRVSLSGSLRRIVDITVTQPEMVKFGDFLRTLPVPTSLHIVKMDPLRGHILLVVESRLIYNLVDCYFGGTGKSGFKVEGRDFTSIEQRVITKVVNTMLNDLDNAWKPVVAVNFQLVRSEVNPQFATIVALSDLLIPIHFELELDRSIGKVILCLPYSTIEPIRSRLNASYQSDQLEVDQDWIERLKRRMLGVEVELLAELGTATIKGRDLLHLEVGDVLLLDQEVQHPLMVSVEGVPKFRGMPGVSKGNQAFQVTEVISPSGFEGTSRRILNYD